MQGKYYHCPECAFSAGHADRCSIGKARYEVRPSGTEYVLIDKCGDPKGKPIYRSGNERRMLDDCEKLNTAWNVMQRLATQGL